jgi:hypothetical protein
MAMAYPTPGIAQTTCLCDDSIVGLWGKDLISRGDTGKIRPCGRMISAKVSPPGIIAATAQAKQSYGLGSTFDLEVKGCGKSTIGWAVLSAVENSIVSCLV